MTKNTTPLNFALRFNGEREFLQGNPLINMQINMVCEIFNLNLVRNHTTSWCSLAMAYSVINTMPHLIPVLKGRINGMAKSWAVFGIPADQNPRLKIGHIVTYDRGMKEWQGHIGHWLGSYKGMDVLYGGNQSDSWCFSMYPSHKRHSIIDPNKIGEIAADNLKIASVSSAIETFDEADLIKEENGILYYE